MEMQEEGQIQEEMTEEAAGGKTNGDRGRMEEAHVGEEMAGEMEVRRRRKWK